MRVPATQPLRPSPAGRVGPAARGEREGYGGPYDVTSLSQAGFPQALNGFSRARGPRKQTQSNLRVPATALEERRIIVIAAAADLRVGRG